MTTDPLTDRTEILAARLAWVTECEGQRLGRSALAHRVPMEGGRKDAKPAGEQGCGP